MSKVGDNPIQIPPSTQVRVDENRVIVKGLLGEMDVELPPRIKVQIDENSIIFKRRNDHAESKAMHGLARSLVNNAVLGVSKKWEKVLKVVGTGYKVKQQENMLVFDVGYSHSVEFKNVEGVMFEVVGNDTVKVSGVNKQLVGQVANKIKRIKKPDVYKGKGIRYDGEILRLKPGKKAKAA